MGVFTNTKFWSRNNLDWEGDNTRVYKQQLCSEVDQRCISGDSLMVADSPGPVIKIPGWLNIRAEPVNSTVLFDKRNGAAINCLDCENEAQTYRRLATFYLN